MTKLRFFLLLILIAAFGLLLRLYQYDKVPAFLETDDEVMYPWGGISFLQTGIPRSWSFSKYYLDVKTEKYWGKSFRMVSPWIEKPPLYSLVTGFIALAAGQNQFEKIQISIIRLIPIGLSIISIIFIGLLAANFFNDNIALLSSFLYATIPTFVVANRLSLTENMLTPISLVTLWLFSSNWKEKSKIKIYLIGIGCGLAVITRQLGLTLPAAIAIILLSKKEWKNLFIVLVITGMFGLIQPLIGFYFNWQIFVNTVKDYKQLYAIGLPGSIFNIFRFPMITYTFSPFIDGSVIFGYLLLFTSPIWLKIKNLANLIAYPFVYLVIFALIQSEKAVFGWHLFPLFPFLAILIAKVFYDFWEDPNPLMGTFIALVIGSSSYRLLTILAPGILHTWQKTFALILIVFLGGIMVKNLLVKRVIIISFFTLFFTINILIILNFSYAYSMQ